MQLESLLAGLESAAPANIELNPIGNAYSGQFANLQDFIIALNQKRKETDPIDVANLCNNGLVRQDTFTDYLSDKAMGSSTIKEVLKTPMHFLASLHEPAVRKDSKAFELGTFVHQAFLEPGRFDLCTVEPNYARNSSEGLNKLIKFWEAKVRMMQQGTGRSLIGRARERVKRRGLDVKKADGKRVYLDALIGLSGLTVVSSKHHQIIKFIKRNFQTYGGGLLPKLLKGALCETSFYGIDSETGLQVKVRPDAFLLEEQVGFNAVISFKTTSADTVQKFVNDCARYDYALSEAMYLSTVSQITGRKFDAVITIALQTVSPYLPIAFFWNAESLAVGHYRYRQAMQAVKDCFESKHFPGFDAFAEAGHQGLIDLDLPNYAKTELPSISIEN